MSNYYYDKYEYLITYHTWYTYLQVILVITSRFIKNIKTKINTIYRLVPQCHIRVFFIFIT